MNTCVFVLQEWDSSHLSHLSVNREGRCGTSDDFATCFLHFPQFSTALCDLANSRPVHSLMLSSKPLPAGTERASDGASDLWIRVLLLLKWYPRIEILNHLHDQSIRVSLCHRNGIQECAEPGDRSCDQRIGLRVSICYRNGIPGSIC